MFLDIACVAAATLWADRAEAGARRHLHQCGEQQEPDHKAQHAAYLQMLARTTTRQNCINCGAHHEPVCSYCGTKA